MFLVKDCHEGRKSKIRSFLEQGEPAIAVILAAANFEWTLRRVIIILGKSTTADIRNALVPCYGLDNYVALWKTEVSISLKKGLPALISNWADVRRAYALRGRLIHGSIGTTKWEDGKSQVEALLKAADALVEVAESQNVSVYERIKVRRK